MSTPKKPLKLKQSEKRKSLPEVIRKRVYGKIDNQNHPLCYCCGKSISLENYHCGHIIAFCNGGKDELNNLMPICPSCNLSMGKQNMYDFMKQCVFTSPYIEEKDTGKLYERSTTRPKIISHRQLVKVIEEYLEQQKNNTSINPIEQLHIIYQDIMKIRDIQLSNNLSNIFCYIQNNISYPFHSDRSQETMKNIFNINVKQFYELCENNDSLHEILNKFYRVFT